MRWAISARGEGEYPAFRACHQTGTLAAGETFFTNFDPTGYVLAEGGGSLRLPTAEEALRPLQRARQQAINDRRDAYIAAGVEFNGWRFDTDPQSISNLTAAVAFIQAAPLGNFTPPASVSWRDADNIDRDLTPAMLVGLGSAMFARVQTAHAIARQLKDAIAAATSEAQILGIDWP
jgi:hypothetical protein